ncbi:MAG TPA: hypothetical protein VHR72_05395 [Gemmataceae bacterium]|jgi:TIGR03009 family protein|nr:hypothetical protein [Gemmataceae bacterium]
MISFGRLGCLCLLAFGGWAAPFESRVLAQAPGAANRLDQVLDNWERALKDVTAFDGQIVRKRTSVRFATTEICEGHVRILKTPATLFASLELARKERPGQLAEKLLLNEKGFCEYDFAAKEVRIHPLSVRPDRADNPIGFLFGVKGKDLKARFDIRLGPADPNYIFLEIAPIAASDKADFARARLTLLRTTSMPAQLWFQQVNQDQTQWDIARVDVRANHLRPVDFAASPTQGWNVRVIPAVTPKQ